ncbi:hypothetical protein G3I59_10365 [Amycolatopsis rubida]|uniref:Uncharacterized protein n=1 Tax=Amycolatopsis rubida TaxID=112413 RepID=A0ABX0BND2_9PSEU|nr:MULTISPECIES: hypothetical protein [Amycolatopsis]MYW90994.1 hypothetical protein [Amycolatopsis rubida]NEC55979.1 hypothetical protein [Amycolatopsis rubida]OAP25933.1 hypothetical protein A4R44_03309 [Amycolatopsis sp. M39]
MTAPELQYRRMVRLLPRWYRADREDEMVGTLLDAREAGRLAEGRELLAMLGLGLRARLAAGSAPARVVAFGDTVRLVALLGLLWGVMKGVVSLGHDVCDVLGYPRTRGLYSFAAEGTLSLYSFPSVQQLGQDVALVAAAAVPLALLFAGRRRAARGVAGVVLVAGFAAFLYQYSFSFSPDLLGYFVPQWLPLPLLIAGFHLGAPPPSARKWRIALTGVAVSGFYFGSFAESDLRGLSWFAWAAALVIPAYFAFRRRSPVWSFSLAVCCSLVLVQPLVLLATMAAGAFEPLDLVQVFLVGAGIAALTAAGIIDYRRQIA